MLCQNKHTHHVITHPLIGKSHGSRAGVVQLQGAPLYHRDGRFGGGRHRRPVHSKGMA